MRCILYNCWQAMVGAAVSVLLTSELGEKREGVPVFDVRGMG